MAYEGSGICVITKELELERDKRKEGGGSRLWEDIRILWRTLKLRSLGSGIIFNFPEIVRSVFVSFIFVMLVSEKLL